MSPPENTEVEVNIFGPGFGECILVHVGFNEWVVIDSCTDSTSGRPSALNYLSSLGVNSASAVKFILATHWHDDHIGGMSDLVSECPIAEFACAAALTKAEFLEIAQIFNKQPLIKSSSGLSEIQKVFAVLKKRRQIPKYAIADLPLLNLPNTSGEGARCELTALSPSQLEFQRFLSAISQLIPQQPMTKYRIPSMNPNDLSVAAWLRVGSLEILMGADLEEHGVAGRGWKAVLASTTRPQGVRASLFKVAHHGSETGHYAPVWSDLLASSRMAVLTPWALGGSQIPRSDDCYRLLGLTPEVYSTSRPNPTRLRNLPQAVTRTLREGGITVRQSEPPTGHIQLRAPMDTTAANWKIVLSSEAMHLNNYLTLLVA